MIVVCCVGLLDVVVVFVEVIVGVGELDFLFVVVVMMVVDCW